MPKAKSNKRAPEPVTTTRMAWSRCQTCGRQVFYRPGKGAAAAALTEHANKEHLAELASA